MIEFIVLIIVLIIKNKNMNVEKINQIYKCNVCGNIVEVVNVGGGELVCCGQPMELMNEKTKDEGMEKHVPVVETLRQDSGQVAIKVKVGSIQHPMEEKHYIQWIEVIVDGKSYKEFLKPGDKPQAEFCITGENITVREYCSIHGLWKA
jgi:superoxide reductase